MTAIEPLIEAVSEFAGRAAEKLRKQDGHAAQLLVFAHTSPYRPGPRFHRSVIVPLRRPTADTAALVRAAVAGLHQIFQPEFDLIKVGVMLLDLSPASRVQHELDLQDDAADIGKAQLMAAMDALNQRYGRETAHSASTGTDDDSRVWRMRQERRTPNYTTEWEQMPVVRA